MEKIDHRADELKMGRDALNAARPEAYERAQETIKNGSGASSSRCPKHPQWRTDFGSNTEAAYWAISIEPGRCNRPSTD